MSRSLNDLRKLRLSNLADSIRRPQFFGWTNSETEMLHRIFLQELCWLDEREHEFEEILALFNSPQGVYGRLAGSETSASSNRIHETAGAYAQIAYRLGYFKPEHVLTVDEFAKLSDEVDNILSRKCSASDIEVAFGHPSSISAGGNTMVYGYASADREQAWVYFDFVRCGDAKDDPLLRSVRRTFDVFEHVAEH